MQIRDWMQRAPKRGVAHGGGGSFAYKSWMEGVGGKGGWVVYKGAAFIRRRSIDKQRMQQCTPVTFMFPNHQHHHHHSFPFSLFSHPRTRQTNWKRKCASPPPPPSPLRCHPCGQHEEANWQIKFHSKWKPFFPRWEFEIRNVRILAQNRNAVWGLWWQANRTNIYNCSQ